VKEKEREREREREREEGNRIYADGTTTAVGGGSRDRQHATPRQSGFVFSSSHNNPQTDIRLLFSSVVRILSKINLQPSQPSPRAYAHTCRCRHGWMQRGMNGGWGFWSELGSHFSRVLVLK
jgi:hypothetical protein